LLLIFRHNDNLRGAKTLENLRVDISDVDIPPLLEVLDYWNRVRGEKFAPSLKEFKIDELAPSIIPCMTIVDFEVPPFDYRYRFFGSMVVQVAGMELTGKRYNADMIEGFGYVNAQIYPEMIEDPRPIVTRTTWLSLKSLQFIATTLRMPLSDDGKRVSGGVTVYNFE